MIILSKPYCDKSCCTTMKKYISNTLLNYLREKTTFTQCIYSKQHLLKTTFTQNNIYSKQHLLKTTFTQNNIYSKQHLLIIVSAVEKYWGYSFLFVYIPPRYHLKVIQRLLVGGGGYKPSCFVICSPPFTRRCSNSPRLM